MMFRPRKLQIGGEYEEDNKFNPTPINLRPQPSYGFVGPMQPTTPNYGPMGPFNYDNSPGLKDDCPEGMTWSEEDQRCVYPNGYDPTQEQEKNKPKGRGIDGMGTPKTGPGTGVNPQDPVKKQQSKIDPYFALRGVTTGLSWLSEMVDRNRQNQYATDQYSTLGQIDPMPVSNFQPNRYNLYAQKGGIKLDPRLKNYMDATNKQYAINEFGRTSFVPDFFPEETSYPTPYSREEINKLSEDYNNFYKEKRPPLENVRNDGYDDYNQHIKKIPYLENQASTLASYMVNNVKKENFIVPAKTLQDIYGKKQAEKLIKEEEEYRKQNPPRQLSENDIYQQGGLKPIYVNNPNDPQYKSYMDTLFLNQWGKDFENKYKKIAGDDIVPVKRGTRYDLALRRGIKPEDLQDNISQVDIEGLKPMMAQFHRRANKSIKPIDYNIYASNPDKGAIDIVTGRLFLNMFGVAQRVPGGRMPIYPDAKQQVIYDPNYKEPVVAKKPQQGPTGDDYAMNGEPTPYGKRLVILPKGSKESDYIIKTYHNNSTGNRDWTYVKKEQKDYPIVTRPEPQLKKSFRDYPLINQENNELNIIPSNNPGQIAGDITPLPYRVEYDGTEHQNFLTEKEGTEFQNSLRNRPQGIPYGTRGYYEKKQKGGKLAPITVDNPNDPRLRAYNDSLNLYKAMQMQDKLMGPKSSISTTKVYPTEWTTKELKDRRNPKKVSGLDMPVAQDFKSEKDQFLDGFNLLWARKQDKQLLDYYKSLGFGQDRIQYHSSPDIVSDKIRPIGNYFDGTAESPIYKKPVQPVVYKKPKPEMYDLNGAPDDILKAYSDWKTGKGNVDEQVKLFRKYKVPETKYKGSPNFSFLEPFEQKDYPIVSRPGAQVRGTITPGQMTRDTTQDGVPIYGPANSTIGYYNDGQFSPYTGVNQRGTVNNPDTELMQNPEALKKYLRGKGLNFKKGGLTPNKARQILHDGTAQGHPLTDKQRRFFGAKSKGHTNFRK